MAKCQTVDIRTQYEKYGVRCFDLRIRFGGGLRLAHGFCAYRYTDDQLHRDLAWLDRQGDCHVRVLHEVRHVWQYTLEGTLQFRVYCHSLEAAYKNIRFWCGRNLYDWEYDWNFSGDEPTCHEDYSSVSRWKYLVGWWPWIYARFHNKKIKETQDDILLIDFVNEYKKPGRNFREN